MKKLFVLCLFMVCFTFMSVAEHVHVAGWASDGMSSEKAIWSGGLQTQLSFLDGRLCGFDIDNYYVYFATYKTTINSGNKDYSDLEISIYRNDEKLYNFTVERVKSPDITNLVVVNGNAYIVVNCVVNSNGGYMSDKKIYDYKTYKNGNLISNDATKGNHSYSCVHLEKSNGYVFMAKTLNKYDYKQNYYWGYHGPNRHEWIETPWEGDLNRLRVFDDNVYLMGRINGSAYICRNNEKPQKISGYKECNDFAIVNNSNYWIVDNILLNSEGKTILTGVYGMRVYGNNLYVWGMNNHTYCYWTVYPNGNINRTDLQSCSGIYDLIITD